MAFLLEGVDAGEAVRRGGVESGEFENGGQSEWLNGPNFDFALFYPAVTAVFGFAGKRGAEVQQRAFDVIEMRIL